MDSVLAPLNGQLRTVRIPLSIARAYTLFLHSQLTPLPSPKIRYWMGIPIKPLTWFGIITDTNRYTLNLTQGDGDGSCTALVSDPFDIQSCSITSNSTTNTIIPPVRSARLNTKGKKAITYGRIEVMARLPVGDWLWPAICMLILSMRKLHH